MDEEEFIAKVTAGEAVVGIVGLGYVGLPLATAFARAGCTVVGFDVDDAKNATLNSGRSYIQHIPDDAVAAILQRGGIATDEPARLAAADAVLVCVPTPLTRHRDPDMRYVEATAAMLSEVLRPGQLIILESTTYPGTTRERVMPLLERGGLKAGRDFFLAYSPEREDPGSQGHSAADIPKVVAGLTPSCRRAAAALYRLVAPETVEVSSLETAEATKLMENIFRCVNIALVNELKQVFTRMEIDIWEVVAAAATKPFGFMPFYPGPGLGGHCIPIDPFYLTWKAREFDCPTRFIELSGEINARMPEYVVERTILALNDDRKSLAGSRVLVVGLAYKKNVDDTRESPSLRLIDLFQQGGAEVDYHDPHVPVAPKTRRYNFNKASVALSASALAAYDAVVIATDHDDVDYGAIGAAARLVVDARNAMARVGGCAARVVKA